MITKISLLNFRKFSKKTVDIKNKFVVITGDNATGKTTLLEAIYVASVTKSLRTNNINELIKDEEEYSLVEIEANSRKYKFTFKDKTKKVSIDNKEINKISDYIGNLPSVFFTPSELVLINGSPQNRRLFLNIELSQLFSKYVNYLSEYNKLLKERNAYLKTKKIDNIYLNLITEKLCEESLKIMKIRKLFIEDINNTINTIHSQFSKDEEIKLEYVNSLPFDNTYKYMVERSSKDIQFENTNHGVHRDDVIFYINNKDAKVYASQGQRRSIVLSLKISLCLLIQKYKRKFPILLLDDVLSELDVTRQNNLLKIILNLGQTFISVTNIDLNDLEVLNNYQELKLESELIDNGKK
ncbi:MAG: DNA replication and repair protein RecF [bacterium]